MDFTRSLIIYGVPIAWAIALGAAAAIYFVCRGNRYLLPQGWRGWLISCVAIIVLIPASVFLVWITPKQLAYPKLNQPAPLTAFHLLDGGETRSLQDYAGKVVLLNFWATWCKACRDEMPDLDKLQQNYGSQGVLVITVSDEPPATVLGFAGLKGMHSINAYVEGDEKSSPLIASAAARPASFIIDSHGVLREILTGGHDYAFYEQHVRKHLGEPDSATENKKAGFLAE